MRYDFAGTLYNQRDPAAEAERAKAAAAAAELAKVTIPAAAAAAAAAPPPGPLKVGEAVEVWGDYPHAGGNGELSFLNAIINAISEEGTSGGGSGSGTGSTPPSYTVTYEQDGFQEPGVARIRIRRPDDTEPWLLEVGERCEARHNGEENCYSGTIVRAHGNDTYDVDYDDEGYYEEKVRG